tara:strand:+ start:1374 stop:1910 length:537 start_codon:yes stop_codon:yes gene_type:complete
MNEKPMNSIAEITDIVKDIVNVNYSQDDEEIISDEISMLTEGLPTQNSELLELLYKVKSIKRAVTTLETKVKNELSAKMQGKATVVGSDVIIGKGTNSYKPYNVDKVLEYLGDDWKMAVRPSFRTTAIKKIAKDRGDNPYVIFDSLFETIITGDVSIVPQMKAPKKYGTLKDGEEMDI